MWLTLLVVLVAVGQMGLVVQQEVVRLAKEGKQEAVVRVVVLHNLNV